jgi:hypothetical protein
MVRAQIANTPRAHTPSTHHKNHMYKAPPLADDGRRLMCAPHTHSARSTTLKSNLHVQSAQRKHGGVCRDDIVCLCVCVCMHLNTQPQPAARARVIQSRTCRPRLVPAHVHTSLFSCALTSRALSMSVQLSLFLPYILRGFGPERLSASSIL